MYESTGSKLKSFAKGLAVFGIIVSVILGLSFAAVGTDKKTESPILVIIGTVVLIIGPIFSWLANLFLASFGELVDNSLQSSLTLKSLYGLMTERQKEGVDEGTGEQGIINQTKENVAPMSAVASLTKAPRFDGRKVGICDQCGKPDVPLAFCPTTERGETRYKYICSGCYTKNAQMQKAEGHQKEASHLADDSKDSRSSINGREKYCIYCGKPLKENSVFCGFCGEKAYNPNNAE